MVVLGGGRSSKDVPLCKTPLCGGCSQPRSDDCSTVNVSRTHVRLPDVRQPGKGISDCHGARPVHLIITMITWIQTGRLSIPAKTEESDCEAHAQAWIVRGHGDSLLQHGPRLGFRVLILELRV